MKNSKLFAALMILCAVTLTGCKESPVKVWTIDSLTKIFQDQIPAASDEPLEEVARGETASLQIVIRSEQKLEALKATLPSLTLENDKTIELTDIKIRFVGYVHVSDPVEVLPTEPLRNPPGLFPDVLFEDETMDLDPNTTQPIWITVNVPTNAKPGLYKGTVNLTALVAGNPYLQQVPVAVKVYPVTVGKNRLWLTNWYRTKLHRTSASRDDKLETLPKSTDRYWDMLRKYARNMAEHRQNMIQIFPNELAQYTKDENGKLIIDFSRFNRVVRIFLDEGLTRIAGGDLSRRIDEGWNNQFGVYVPVFKDGKGIVHRDQLEARADVNDPRVEEYLTKFLPALMENLKQQGWTEIYAQHVADEPIDLNAQTYRTIAAYVRKYMPGIPIIEACHTANLDGAIDIWIPQIDYFKKDLDLYKKRQAAGNEVWFYTSMYPQGDCANRFIEQPLWKTRLIHWINFHYDTDGYLHWAYNNWSDTPFEETVIKNLGPKNYLPGGDSWIVYPGLNGPLDSIRFEAMRDGVADHELLSMLAENDPAAAKAFTSRFIQDYDKYTCDEKSFRQARRELLKLLSE